MDLIGVVEVLKGEEEALIEVEALKEEDLICRMLSLQEEEVKMTEISQKGQEVATSKTRTRISLLLSRKIIAKPKISIRIGQQILSRISLQNRTCQNFFKVSKPHLRKKMILRTKDTMMRMMAKITKMTMESMERKNSKN